MRTGLPDVKGLGRIVRGQVSASGGIVSGTGFTVTKTGTGLYTITFVPPFKSLPGVSLADINNWVARLNASGTAAQIFVQTFDGAAALSDTAFQFTAMEAIPA